MFFYMFYVEKFYIKHVEKKDSDFKQIENNQKI